MLLELYMESCLIRETDEPQVKLSKKKINDLAKEWAFLESQVAVMNLITKKIATRVDEIQSQLLPIVKKEEAKSLSVKHAMIEYTTRKTTSVKYQAAFERALEEVNEEQRAFLKEYKETVTTRGVIENVKLIDPKLGQLLNELKTKDLLSLLDLLPKVKSVDEAYTRRVAVADILAEGKVKDAVVKLVEFFLAQIKRLTRKQKSSIIAVSRLEQLASRD